MRQEKDRVRARELYRQMDRKEKIRHLWEYYRLPALGVLLLAAAVISLAVGIYGGWRSAGQVQLGVFGAEARLADEAVELARERGWTEEVSVVTGPSADGEDGVAVIQITCLLAADDLDVVLCDRATADFILQDGEVPARLWPLGETALAGAAGEDVCLVLIEGTERGEKAESFTRLLGAAELSK